MLPDTKRKTQDILFITLLTLVTVVLRTENNIYTQFFPELISYLNIEENNVDYIFRINFLGAAISSLFVGPFADSYGRRNIFIIGLLLYVISSLACFISSNFLSLLFWRFIEGIAKSIPLVIGWIIIFDKFPTIQLGKYIGFIKGISTLILAIIPLFTFWLSQLFNWHVDFFFIFILAMIALIISIFFVEETLPLEKRKKFNLLDILKSYLLLLKNFEFVAYTIIFSLSCATYVLFFSNTSVIFIDQLEIMNKEEFSTYQSIGSCIYIISSFLSMYVIDKKGINYTNQIGFSLFITGCLSMFIFSQINANNYHAVFISMMIIIAGNALMNGFLLKAINIFPNIRGAAMSLNTTIKVILSARAIFWSHVFFDNSIIPTTIIIFCCAIISIILFIILKYKSINTR